MATQKSSSADHAESPERAPRARQRQRLIDACISALHIHGPSRTTVEKVVALADMSPGIVRFYFDSKDAMLVASLAYLAAEFEERLMKPVARLKETPVRALEQLVELYLDPEIASPRKVSVWYSFWGEASSRQEYYEICGKKDDDFASLVRELVERVVAQSGQSHLDPDAVALGLIGVLEVLWQDIAFKDESQIDRPAAKRRSLSFLRSVFPGQFGAVARRRPQGRIPAWAYGDAELLSLERERLLRPSWQLVGHEEDLPGSGDFLTLELATERALVLRDAAGRLRAFRNSCRKRPHTLVSAHSGHFAGEIRCEVHGLAYGLDGSLRTGETPGDLLPLDLTLIGSLILVRSPGPSFATPAASSAAPAGAVWETLRELRPGGTAEVDVAADWKLLVEQWLDATPTRKGVQRSFASPNQLLEINSGAVVLQLIPQSGGHCRIRCLNFSAAARNSRRRSASAPAWLAQDIEVAESIQAGLAAGAAEPEEPLDASPALSDFRAMIGALLPEVHASRTS